MKKVISFLVMCVLSLSLIACGNTQKDVETIGQVKRITFVTPLIWPSFKYVDISFGVMRNGVGSMSTEDVWIVVSDKTQENILKNAAETGQLVKAVYNKTRFPLLYPANRLESVEVVK